MLDDNNNSLIPQYEDILENGLPKIFPKKKDVIVLGAGMAGLLSAKLLKDSGYNVTILEANANRIGGRVKTFKTVDGKIPFSDPYQYAEAGAMRIPTTHPLVNKLIENFRLQTQSFYNVDVDKSNNQKQTFRTWIRCNDIQVRHIDYKNHFLESATPTIGFPVPEKLQNKTAQELLDTALSKLNKWIARTLPLQQQIEGWVKIISKYDDYDIYQYLKEFYSDDVVLQYIGTLDNMTSRFFLSFLHSFIDTFYINSETQYVELVGGNQNLPYAFVDSLKENIVMNARATEIGLVDDKTNHSQIPNNTHCVYVKTISEYDESNPTTILHEKKFTADHLIISIPFSSLRFVDIIPPFSYHKRRAIIELHYDSATKILLEFSKRFWEWDKETWHNELGTEYRGHDSYGGGSITDNPNRFIFFPSHKIKNSDGGVILASYTWSDDANRWDSIPDNDRYLLALKGLTDIYGTEIKKFFTGHGQTQSWMENFYSFGEAAVFTPGQITALQPYIPTPEGNIHFAGEHTSLKHAWIEGALESAIKVSLEIHKSEVD